jgi:hypothetical protein
MVMKYLILVIRIVKNSSFKEDVTRKDETLVIFILSRQQMKELDLNS